MVSRCGHDVLKRLAGQRSERQAERWLQRQGLKTLTRNWSCRHGEIDLVMIDQDSLVFVEVRMRSPRGFGSGADSVHSGKQIKLIHAASMFLADHPEWQDRPCRFDVLSIEGPAGREEWIQAAFEANAGD